ncbi:hypothetical protein [Helicobacter ganmani]
MLFKILQCNDAVINYGFAVQSVRALHSFAHSLHSCFVSRVPRIART